MAATKQLTKQEFLQYYSDGDVTDVFTIQFNSEQRVYGKSPRDAANQPSGYYVVYCVV